MALRLQASNDALEARASAAEAEALQLRAKLGAAQSEAALARAQLQEQLGCMRTMATASEIATATARKLLVERHTLQGRLSQVLQEKADVKAIWAGCGSRAIALKVPACSRTPSTASLLPLRPFCEAVTCMNPFCGKATYQDLQHRFTAEQQ